MTATSQKRPHTIARRSRPFGAPRRTTMAAVGVALVAWLLAVLGPYIWTFITSITPASELNTGGASYWPEAPTFEAYGLLLEVTPFLQYLGNSLLTALGTVALTVVIGLAAAIALSRYRFGGRRVVLMSILLVQVFPAVLLLVPLYAELRAFGLLDTRIGLILVYVTFATPFATWLLKGFMDEIPVELEEAARVDGASSLQMYWHVLLPLMRPGIAAAATYAFIYSWNEFIYAVTFASSTEVRTIPVGLSLFIGESTIRWELLTAGGVLAALPIILGFMFVQRHLVAGLTSGAVKG